MKVKINNENYLHNLKKIAEQLGSSKKIAVVLKDNAYGHGIQTISALALQYGITKAIVRNINEAIKIKNKFSYILVLSQIPETLQDKNIVIAINSIYDLKKVPKKSNIDLKIDTNMHRNGIVKDEIAQAFRLIKKFDLKLNGIFTHFSSSDELSSNFFVQQKNWIDIKQYVSTKYPTLNLSYHSENSSAIFRNKTHEDDFARVGLASFGYVYLPFGFLQPKLKPVMSIVANKISSKIIYKKQKVGYSGLFIADKDMKISTYDIGYANGLPWQNKDDKIRLPNNNYILGKISMDYISVDSQDEEILIFDDVSYFANKFNTIIYDILLKMGKK